MKICKKKGKIYLTAITSTNFSYTNIIPVELYLGKSSGPCGNGGFFLFSELLGFKLIGWSFHINFYKLCPGGDIEFGIDVFHMGLNGVFTDEKLIWNKFISLALEQKF